MSSLESKVCSEVPSATSNEEQVAQQLMTWVRSAFAYYANADTSATPTQTLHKLADYLASITQQLRTPDLAGPDTPNPTGQGEESISAKNEKQLPKETTMKPGKESKAEAPASPKVDSASSTDDQCRICLEAVAERRFAILEACEHKYCEPCLRSWIEQNPNQSVKCPTCRVHSSRVIFRSQFLGAGAQKEAEFGSVLCCAAHQPEIEEGEEMDNLDNGQLEVVEIVYQDAAASDDDPNDPEYVPLPNVDEDESDESLSVVEENPEDLRLMFAESTEILTDDELATTVSDDESTTDESVVTLVFSDLDAISDFEYSPSEDFELDFPSDMDSAEFDDDTTTEDDDRQM